MTLLAEEVILGTMLKEPHLLEDTDLNLAVFTTMENRNLLKNMRYLKAKGLPVDMVTLLTQCDQKEFGGAGKLNKIMNLANEKKFESYVEMIYGNWREREKLNILEIAKHENWSLDKITSMLNELHSNKVNDHHSIKELVLEVAELPYKQTDKVNGVPVGLPALQQSTDGWQKTDLIILAARPSMGKTDVMLHFAKYAGWSNYIPIVFSLEMNAEKLNMRLIASTGPYNRTKMKDPYERLSEQQKQTWMPTIQKVAETNIEIFDKSGQTLPEIRMKIRKVKNENPNKEIVVFIDYLTLIRPTDGRNGNMHLITSDISKGLKEIAKEFNCPVISLAQLNRGVEQRQDKRPMMSDLRESGSIEEDADTIIFLYRDAYYTKEENDDSLEFIIAKNRNGEVGTVTAKYNKFTGVVS